MTFLFFIILNFISAQNAFSFDDSSDTCLQRIADYQESCAKEPGKSWEAKSNIQLKHQKVLLETGVAFKGSCQKFSKEDIKAELFLATIKKIEDIQPRLQVTCEKLENSIEQMQSIYSQCAPLYKAIKNDCSVASTMTEFQNPRAWEWGKEVLQKTLDCRSSLDWQCNVFISELLEAVNERGGGVNCTTDLVKKNGECISE